MRSIKELNVHGKRQSPLPSQISALNEKTGLNLPESFVEFLMQANGGNPEINTYKFDENEEYSINNFFYLGDEDGTTESLDWNYINRWDGIPSNCLPFARDGGDNLFVLNFGNDDDPTVWIWMHDSPADNFKMLSEKFEYFIDDLAPNPDYI